KDPARARAARKLSNARYFSIPENLERKREQQRQRRAPHRRCRKCKSAPPRFARARYCVPCAELVERDKAWSDADRLRMRLWYQANRERQIAAAAAYRRSNSERNRAWQRSYRERNKSAVRGSNHANKLKTRNRIAESTWQAIAT